MTSPNPTVEAVMHAARAYARELDGGTAVTIATAKVKLRQMVEALAVDADRYRVLRAQQWYESALFVVAGSKAQVRLGTDCPSLERLDAAVDAIRAACAGQPEVGAALKVYVAGVAAAIEVPDSEGGEA